MVDIADDSAHSDVARWKTKCLKALEANDQFSVLAKGRVSDLARLLGRLARALPPDKANTRFIKDLSQLAQALSGRPFDESLNRDIRSGYERLLKVIAAHEGEQAGLLAALNEAVAELEPLAGSWLLKRRLKRFRKSLSGKQNRPASQLVGDLKDLQKAALKSLRDNVVSEDPDESPSPDSAEPVEQIKNAAGNDSDESSPDAGQWPDTAGSDTGEPSPDAGQRPDTAGNDSDEPSPDAGQRPDTTGSDSGEPSSDADQRPDTAGSTMSSAHWPAVQQVLLRLLERVESVTETREQLQHLRRQVVAGVNEHTLIPVLGKVRDLFDASMSEVHGEYQQFLDAVDQRLGGLLSSLGQVLAQGQSGIEKRRQFNSGIENGFAQIRAQANAAEDLNTLKHSIDDNLQHLGQVLSDYRLESDADADRTHDQLKALSTRLVELEGESKQAREQLDQQRSLALTDSLTKLPNRRALDERLEHEFAQWQRYDTPLSIAILDIDHFKKVNDNYGHAGGDRALELMAGIITNRIRQVDFAARFGGEEFVILMPSTELEQAGALLEQLRGFIEDCGFKYQGQPVQITVSFGLTEMREGDAGPQIALERADGALYKAKQSGRNRVCSA